VRSHPLMTLTNWLFFFFFLIPNWCFVYGFLMRGVWESRSRRRFRLRRCLGGFPRIVGTARLRINRLLLEVRRLWKRWSWALVSSCTNFIFRSEWIVWFETYGGAFRSILSAMFWKVWILFMFDFFALTYNCIPYVQTGLIKDLYMSSCVDISKFWESVIKSLDLICWAQVNLRSRVSPRYFIVWAFGKIP